MSLFKFGAHAAAATEKMGVQRDTSLRVYEGVRLRVEITDFFSKTGEDPKTIAKKGEYVNAGFKFRILGAERLPDSTEAQLETATKAVGTEASIVWKLFGNADSPAFAVQNQYTLRDMLALTYAAMANNVAATAGVDAARSFKSPFFAGNYPSEEERAKAAKAIGDTLSGALEGKEQEADMLRGSALFVDSKPGKEKPAEKGGGMYYNIYYNVDYTPASAE